MKRVTLYAIAMLTMLSGCTATGLKNYTVNQVASLTDARYQQVIDDLAATAANPAMLPSYAPLGEGSSVLNETFVFDPKTLWQRAPYNGFMAQSFGLTMMRQPQPSWTVNPVAQYQMVQAMLYSCQWAHLRQPPAQGSDAEKVLKVFQIYDDLMRLQARSPNWLNVGRCREVPGSATYKSHSGDVAVWVCPEGMEGFSAFTLILQDIATVDLTSLQPSPAVGTIKIKKKADQPSDQKEIATALGAAPPQASVTVESAAAKVGSVVIEPSKYKEFLRKHTLQEHPAVVNAMNEGRKVEVIYVAAPKDFDSDPDLNCKKHNTAIAFYLITPGYTVYSVGTRVKRTGFLSYTLAHTVEFPEDVKVPQPDLTLTPSRSRESWYPQFNPEVPR